MGKSNPLLTQPPSMSFLAASHLPGQSWSSRPTHEHVHYPGTSSAHAGADPTSHTQQPIMTGTSVLGLKYDGGVMLAADNLASYGSLARFDDIQRLHRVGTHTCVGASGDMSDYQQLQHQLDGLTVRQSGLDDGHTLRTSQVFEYLSRVMYGKRSKMDPLWNSLVVAGWETSKADGEGGSPFLAYVDLQGTTYAAPTIATGYGAYIAVPLLRKALEDAPDGVLSEAQAEEVLKTCMKVLFYRDARSINKFQIAKIDKSGVQISDSQSADTYWDFADKLRGYGPQTA